MIRLKISLINLGLFSRRGGFSLVEVILAIALFSLFAVALIGLIVSSYGSDYQASERDKAVIYAQTGLDAVSSIRRQAWNLLVDGDHGLGQANGYWELSGASDSSADGKYTRVITISPACRNGVSNIISCSEVGATIDLNTKKVISKVSYTAITLMAINIELTSYLTTWQTKDWIQTDWSGGSGQNNWLDETRYSSDDGNIDYSTIGEVKLTGTPGGGCGVKVWPFDTFSDYTYDSAKIEVVAGSAQLASGSGPLVINQTINPSFSTALTPWTFGSWGTATPTGSRFRSGGNPGGYARMVFPNTKNRVVGGYFQQAFTVTDQTISTAALNLDWNISQFTGLSDSLTLYAFIDTVPGQPVLSEAVWNSGNQTAIRPWTSVSNIDVLNKITGPGTYYLKVAVYVDYAASPNRRYTIGFDNVSLSWLSPGTDVYPSDNPTINPVVSYRAPEIGQWSSFAETATKNGGEIYYQLSDDDGATWKYWDSAAWTNAGVGQYNTAAVVNANISSFPVATSQIIFRAFLNSDGSQLVRLDQIAIGCEKFRSWPFSEPTDYSYDNNKIEVTGGYSQLKSQTSSFPGGTTNPDFSTTLTPWTFGRWGTVNPTGSRSSTGGNPDGYAKIQFPNTKNRVAGGYFQQSFEVTAQTVTSANLSLDWIVSQYTRAADGLHLYVFIDPASGVPVIGTQVWDSGNQTGTTAWANVSNLNVLSKITGPGTYYLKIVAYVDYPNSGANARYAIGFDNVLLSGDGTYITYPSDSPTIAAVNLLAIAGLDQWSSFTETANKNGGEIYYQLSEDGVTWRYFDGAGWISSLSNYNLASLINSNINTFPTTTGQITFRAFLTSNGSQQVQLDNVRIGWGESVASGYATSGWLESSAFDTGGASAFNFISWTENLPSANEDIKIQIATAPTAAGPWSWYGLTGVGSYYQIGDQTLIPLANNHNDNRWIKYRAELTGDGNETPIFQDIKINYLP